MEDTKIISLYWDRDQQAISETAVKYGHYCHQIAWNILSDQRDAEESVNDTYLSAWNTIPPHRPQILSTFLGKITRRISIDRWRRRTADKRGGGELTLALEELEGCLPSAEDVQKTVERRQLLRSIDQFLAQLPQQQRDIFVSRYWFLAPVKQIAQVYGLGESQTKMQLKRIREKLVRHLQEEDYL